MNSIEIKGVSRSFKDTKALKHIDLCFEENKIYGLLGRNGAGKSTLLNIIANRKFADEGTVSLNGVPAMENEAVLQNMFLANEDLLYPENMKVRNIFKATKHFYPSFDMEYALKLAKKFDLPLKKKASGLSTGYKSILKNIVALSVNVPYIFFDEPVLGLDAYHRDLFYRLLLEKYSEEPFTAVISTHLIEEIANVVEEVIIIKKGEILKNESRDSLLGKGYTISGPASLVDAYVKNRESMDEIIGVDSLGGLKSAYILGTPNKELAEGLEISPMDLQKLFIQLTGE